MDASRLRSFICRRPVQAAGHRPSLLRLRLRFLVPQGRGPSRQHRRGDGERLALIVTGLAALLHPRHNRVSPRRTGWHGPAIRAPRAVRDANHLPEQQRRRVEIEIEIAERRRICTSFHLPSTSRRGRPASSLIRGSSHLMPSAHSAPSPANRRRNKEPSSALSYR